MLIINIINLLIGIISLLNDIRLTNNKPPLGFLNPWLYQTATNTKNAFYDVTVGCVINYCSNFIQKAELRRYAYA